MEGLLSFLLFAGLFFLMMRYGCGAHVMHGGHGHGEHSAHDEHDEKREVYTCPMHPEVRESRPGSCPKCGMTLEPASRKGGK